MHRDLDVEQVVGDYHVTVRALVRCRDQPKTAQAYQALFQRMLVLDLIPAWFSNRIKRLVKAVLGLGREAILYGPDQLGRLLDTFVAAQLRAELAASS